MRPTSFRLPEDALERIRQLAQPGESQSSVIKRSLIALEGFRPPVSLDGLAVRVDALEARLITLEGERAPDMPD